MKLLQCDSCADLLVLDYEWRECRCHLEGGMYNDDGDTVLVTAKARLFGFCNHLRFGREHPDCQNAWPYPENHKVTRLREGDPRPTTLVKT